MEMWIRNREGYKDEFDAERIRIAVSKAGVNVTDELLKEFVDRCEKMYREWDFFLGVEQIQDCVEEVLWEHGYREECGKYIAMRTERNRIRDIARVCKDFIKKYENASNTANATIDDNSNVNNRNIAVCNSEIHKSTNIEVSRSMIVDKLRELYPDFNAKSYIKDLKSHIVYKHDESTFAGAVAPYCCSISMHEFLTNGLKNIGGKSSKPTNLDSYCGGYINMIFLVASQFAGAVATSEFLMAFDYFCRKQFGEDYTDHLDEFYTIGPKLRTILNRTGKWFKSLTELEQENDDSIKSFVTECKRPLSETELQRWNADWESNDFNPETFKLYKLGDGSRTIGGAILQYFQQVVYSINQPAASRGNQAAFVNFSYFDKPFFEGMFGNYKFPMTEEQERMMSEGEDVDFDTPCWETTNKLQKMFIMWFNAERLKNILTFPVESFALVYKDGKFVDEDNAKFVAKMYSEGHSFFTYISDSVDSLSSCCRLKNVVSHEDRQFNFTNGNMGVMTGSKSVITLNLSRIVQDFCKKLDYKNFTDDKEGFKKDFAKYLNKILERVYKYHTAYNECLWDRFKAGMLPVYTAGMIDLNKQYLTNGLNGLNEAAEFLGLELTDNDDYAEFCNFVFGTIKSSNQRHAGVFNSHELKFNTECVPAESLGAKNYNWDKAEGYWVPENRNLYASYIFLPSKPMSVTERIRMHGSKFIGDFLDGGSAAHINLDTHLTFEQYWHTLNYSAKNGCQYLTFNIPYSKCKSCGHIVHKRVDKCPVCESDAIDLYDRVIGYLVAVNSMSDPRSIEWKTRSFVSSM